MANNHAALAAVLLLTAVPASAKGIDFFRRGVPVDRVAGVALLKLKDIDAHHLVVDGAPLKGLSQRTGVDVTFVRPMALGWAFVEVRPRGQLAVPSEKVTLDIVHMLAADPAVSAASDDKWMRALRVPNDPDLPSMWHFDIINAQQAWDTTVGLATQRIGIVDTGLVRSHEDVGNRAVGGFDFISSAQTGNDGDGRDADFNDPGDACQGQASSFHGTHVAGTIGATADNGVGVVGLNWNAGLVIARALGVCGGDLGDIADAAVWLAGGHIDNVPDNTSNKVSVINLSLGSDSTCSSLEQQAVDFANQHGTIFVAAAGNSGQQLGQQNSVGSPANCTGAIAVGAHGPQRDLAFYSSFGPEISIVGPGGDIEDFGQQAGGVLSSIGPTGSGYAREEGTSMATPHVVGTISLMQAINSALTRDQVVSILQSSGAACNGCGGKVALDAAAAVAQVTPGAPPPPPPPPPSDDAFEDNDSFDTAVGGIDCNQTYQLTALPSDQDWFLFNTAAGESIDIAISSQNGADLDLYALNGPTNNDVIATSNGNTGDEQIHVDADGTALHILIDPFVDTQNNVQNTGPYTLTTTCTGATPPPPPPPPPPPQGTDDAFEPNNTLAQAPVVFCGQDLDLIGADDDFFQVELRAGDTLAAEITTSSGALTTQILSSAGDVLADGSDTAAASAPSLDAGTYVVRVSPSAGAIGAYHLRPSCVAAKAPLHKTPAAEGGCASTGSTASIAALALALLLVRRRRA